MSEEEKKTEEVEGFVAWHPSTGVAEFTFSEFENDCLFTLADSYDYPCTSGNEHDADAFLQSEDGNGWRIRPCKIVFTDESPWIPVTERLPEDRKPVLCLTMKGQQCVARRRREYEELGCKEYIWDDPDDIRSMKDWYVTHWMPLPPALKQKDGER